MAASGALTHHREWRAAATSIPRRRTLTLGWSLTLPSVSRKTAIGLPRYDDTDVFVLFAMEDLVPVVDDARTLGDDRMEGGERYRIARYRPRTEELFARIDAG